MDVRYSFSAREIKETLAEKASAVHGVYIDPNQVSLEFGCSPYTLIQSQLTSITLISKERT